jgi:hypothetical protein
MDQITHQSPRQRGYGSTSCLRNDSLNHTRKHERKEGGIKPRNKAARHWRTVRPGGANCPHGPRGLSGQIRRTVRTRTADCPAWVADCPKKPTEPPVATPGKMDRPRGGRGLSACPRTIRPSAADCPKPRRTKTRKQNGPKMKTSKNTTNTRRGALAADRPPQARRPSAPQDRGKNCSNPKVNSTNSSPDLPNGRGCWDKSLGTWYASTKDVIPQNFCLLTP